MHYALSTTWGPTDPTRASLPFSFAATALAAAGGMSDFHAHARRDDCKVIAF